MSGSGTGTGTVVTGRSAYDADGNLMVYQPPNVVRVGGGEVVPNISVTYGEWTTVQAGEDGPGPGTYEIGSNSGRLRGQEEVTYRTVTITGARS